MAAAAQILPSTNPRPRGENRRRCRRRGADSTRQEWRAGGLLWLASPRFPSPISCSFCPQQLSKNGGQSMCSSPLPFCWRASPSPVAASMASRQPSGIGDASFLGPKAKSLLGSVAKPVCFTLWRMAQYDYVASRFFRKLINNLAGYPHIIYQKTKSIYGFADLIFVLQ
jgi:hypothetical protein